MTERIAEAYQLILEQVNEISVGKDSTIESPPRGAMEPTKQSPAGSQSRKWGHRPAGWPWWKRNASVLKTSIQESWRLDGRSAQGLSLAANQSVQRRASRRWTKRWQPKKKAQQALKLKNERTALGPTRSWLKIGELELRKEQASEFGDVHRARIKEHTTREVERIMAEHGLENPVIQLSEDENNRIRIHIEEWPWWAMSTFEEYNVLLESLGVDVKYLSKMPVPSKLKLVQTEQEPELRNDHQANQFIFTTDYIDTIEVNPNTDQNKKQGHDGAKDASDQPRAKNNQYRVQYSMP